MCRHSLYSKLRVAIHILDRKITANDLQKNNLPQQSVAVSTFSPYAVLHQKVYLLPATGRRLGCIRLARARDHRERRGQIEL